jgi:hypothetical protein
MKENETPKLGGEAPRLKDFIIVIIFVLVLTALSWIFWFMFR